MPRAWSNSFGQPGRRLSWWNSQNEIYEGIYARGQSQTRSSRRLHDGLMEAANYGLDADDDDQNTSAFASPYYVNGRYFSKRAKVNRANISSRYGIYRRICPDERLVDFTDDDILTWLKLRQGERWEFQLNCENNQVIGNTITIRNTGKSKGYLLIEAAQDRELSPDYMTFIALRDLTDEAVHKKLYDINTITPENGSLWISLSIYDDIKDMHLDLEDESRRDYPDTSEPFAQNTYIEIAASGMASRQIAEYEMPNTNRRLQEIQYDYHRKPSAPLIGLIYSTWAPVPVDKIGNEQDGATVFRDGHRYDIFAGNNGTDAKLFIYDYEKNSFVDGVDIPIDLTTPIVYIGQPDDSVYFVDKAHALRQFVIGSWEASDVTADNSESGTPLQAPDGAGLLCFYNNRLYLANFPDEPNLAMCSQIEKDGPHYNEFPYRWYIPNKNQKETSSMPITAVVPYSSTSIMFATTKTASLFTASASFETGIPTLLDFYGDNTGVESQGDICNYAGTIYQFSSTEGIRRFNGAKWEVVPNSVNRLFRRVDMSKPRKLFGYSNGLYFSYIDSVDGQQKVLFWDMLMNYQQYPWFQDTNISFADVRADKEFNILSTHAKYLCVENIYHTDTWADFDTPIVLERHSKYFQVPGLANDMILRRLWPTFLGDSTRSWWVALSLQTKRTMANIDAVNNVFVWRKVVHKSIEKPDAPTDIFKNVDTEQPGIKRTSIDLSASAISFQWRIKTYTFDSQANMLYVLPEIGPTALR